MADGKTHQIYYRKGWALIFPLGAILLVVYRGELLYPLFLYLNYFIGDFLSPDYDLLGLSSDEGDVLRTAKKFHVGLLGAFWVSYWFIYAYVCGMFGGHRSWFSHSLIIGTLGRMIWFNIPLLIIMSYMINYSIVNWGSPPWDEIGIRYYWMNVWLVPYIVTQFVAWSWFDFIHLVLDGILFEGLYSKKNTKGQNND